MHKRLMTRALSACLLLACAAALRAGTVYTINFSSPGDTGTVTFDSASLLAEAYSPTVLAFSAFVDGLNFSTPVNNVIAAVYNPDGTLRDVRIDSHNGGYTLQLDGGIQPPGSVQYVVAKQGDPTFTYDGIYTLSLAPTPEPATPLFLGSGMLALAWLFRRKRSR